MGAYWGRAGVAAALTPPGQDLPYQRGGFGDHLTGMSLAGGLSAALFARQRTGVGQLVSTSLLRAGMYQMGADINTSLRTGWPTARGLGPVGAQPAAHRLPVRQRGVDLAARPRR